jgi:hypothetical protein
MSAEIRALPQFMAMKPTAHGGYFLLMDGDVILTVPYGTWGMRCTSNYIEDVSRVVKSADSQAYSSMVVFEEWQLATPAAIAKLKAFTEQAGKEHGLKAECYIGKSCSTAVKVAEEQLVSNTENLKVVEYIYEAIDWLVGKGFEFSQMLIQTAYDNRNDLIAYSKR